MGLVTAGDGAMVLMARHDRPGHVGVWLQPERRIIHADQPAVTLQDLAGLRASGWRKLRFYEPAGP
jgi:hypothetical protein